MYFQSSRPQEIIEKIITDICHEGMATTHVRQRGSTNSVWIVYIVVVWNPMAIPIKNRKTVNIIHDVENMAIITDIDVIVIAA